MGMGYCEEITLMFIKGEITADEAIRLINEYTDSILGVEYNEKE